MAKTNIGYRYFTGIPLLEVFSISISKNIDNERRSELYGMVQVTDGRGTKAALYDRDHENSESINPNETITITGPPRCISSLTDVVINLNLKDKYQDLEISNGKIHWDLNSAVHFDKLLAVNVPGHNGFATVNCAIFSAAIEANVEIELIRKDQSDGGSDMPVDDEFYGTIVAYYGQMFDYSSSDQKKYFRTMLFNRPASNCLNQKPGKSIPLSRSVVAVPGYSSLVIEAELFLRGVKVEILKGSTPELLVQRYFEAFIIGGGSYDAKVTLRWVNPHRDEDFK